MQEPPSTNRKQPSICFVAPNLGPLLFADHAAKFAGGAEFRQHILAQALARRGFQVCVVTTDRGERLTETADGIRVVYVPRSNGGWPVVRFIHPRVTSWWRALRAADADIYFQSTAGFLTLLVGCFCRFNTRKFLYSAAHDLDFQPKQLWRVFQRRGGWRDRQMYQAGLRLADAIVAQHPGQVSDCRESYAREAVEVPNCYESPNHGSARSDGVVLWVSTLRSWKRPELFLELARKSPHLRFRMVGGAGEGKDAPLFDTIRLQASNISNLDFVGFVPIDEVERHFDDARVFVNTSTFEGFPNTFLQSWVRGIPTVSLINCYCEEQNEPVNIVCADLDEMIRAIGQLTDDDAVWHAHGRRAQVHATRHHSVDAAANAYSSIFVELTLGSQWR